MDRRRVRNGGGHPTSADLVDSLRHGYATHPPRGRVRHPDDDDLHARVSTAVRQPSEVLRTACRGRDSDDSPIIARFRIRRTDVFGHEGAPRSNVLNKMQVVMINPLSRYAAEGAVYEVRR